MPIVLWITIFIGKRGTNKASYGEIESFSKRNCDSAGIKPRNGEKVSTVKGPVPLTRKRSKFPDQPENLKLWLDRKNIYFECVQNDFDLAFSKELPDRLKKGFKTLKPVYDFLCKVEG